MFADQQWCRCGGGDMNANGPPRRAETGCSSFPVWVNEHSTDD